jgi:DNA repair protein RecN (Recombination protein N)
MLAELQIDDLVLIEAARLEFAPGLNVITGETGAGKSLLAQAIGLLMGQKGGDDLIRPGAERALVQALFEPSGGGEDGDADAQGTTLDEADAPAAPEATASASASADADDARPRRAETLAVARELPRGGRSRARRDGLLSSAGAVEEALRERLAFYGQLEHTRLLQLERQLDLLDGFAPAEIGPLAAAYTEAYRHAQALTRELDELRSAGREREREIDMLRFQVDEIDAARLEPGEDERLALERERLRHAGKLLERVGGAVALLAGEGEHAALDAVRVAQRLAGEAAALDESLGGTAARLDALTAELDDTAAALRAYLEDLDVDPAHRDALETRYDRVRALQRKYGATADAVLAYADEARARLARLEEFEADGEALAGAAEKARAAAVAAAGRLTAARAAAAPVFAARVEEELRQLAMPHARFEVRVTPRVSSGPRPSHADAPGPSVAAADTPETDAAWSALGARGADDVEFFFGANPGMPLRPLRETASGGELSRVMLTIRGMVTLGDDVETLIFDEVDAGIGGVTAAALGERLAKLAERRQIVCITHLPQVAACADRQYSIVKVSDAEADTTRTEVRLVEGDERLAELCRMLGASPDDAAARRHAQGLLKRAKAAPG